MFNVGTPELLVIMLVALVILGPQRLPEAARQVGRAMSELRRISSGFQAEMRDAMQSNDPPTTEPPEDRPVVHPTVAEPVVPADDAVVPPDDDPTAIQEAGGAEPTP